MKLSKYTVAVALSLLALQAPAETFTPSAGASMTLAVNQVQQLGAALAATGTFNADVASTTIAATGLVAANSLTDTANSNPSEPGTYVLLAAALAAMGFVARRRQP